VFVKNKANVASKVGCTERGVLYFRELLFNSNIKLFSFRNVESNRIVNHLGRDLLYGRGFYEWCVICIKVVI